MSALDGKVAVVTGAGRGIGRVIARKLASLGASVVVNDSDSDAALETVEEITGFGVRCTHAVADVTSETEVVTMFRRAVEMFGGVDILVNNAGVGGSSLVVDMPLSEWNRVLEVNVTGTFLCSREASRIMVPRRWGRIINIASIAAKRISLFGGAHYTASKSAVIGFTRHLAYELGRFNITVNAVCPGETLTDMTRSKLTEGQVVERRRLIPAGRLCTPEDHAELVAFLASPGSAMITGQAIDVDGGSLLGWMDYETYEAQRRKAVR